MDFQELAIIDELQGKFLLIISEILARHNQRWPMNVHFKLLLSVYMLKKLIVLLQF